MDDACCTSRPLMEEQQQQEERLGVDVLVLLLFGIPGAGKSTVAHTVASLWENHAESTGYQRQQQQRAEAEDEQAKGGHSSSIHPAVTGTDTAVSFDPLIWRKAQLQFRQHVAANLSANLLPQPPTESIGVRLSEDTNNNNNNDGRRCHLVLVVDNFYLKSMRMAWWKLIKDTQHHASSVNTVRGQQSGDSQQPPRHSFRFGTVLVDASLEECMARNSAREGSAWIPVHVLRKQKEKFEGGALHTSPGSASDGTRIPHLSLCSIPTVEEAAQRCLSFALTEVRESRPPPPPGLVGADTSPPTVQTAIHQVDLALRKECGLTIKAKLQEQKDEERCATGGGSRRVSKTQLGTVLNDVRRKIVDEWRTQQFSYQQHHHRRQQQSDGDGTGQGQGEGQVEVDQVDVSEMVDSALYAFDEQARTLYVVSE